MRVIFSLIVMWFAGVLVFAMCDLGLVSSAVFAVAIGLGALAIVAGCLLAAVRAVYQYIVVGGN